MENKMLTLFDSYYPIIKGNVCFRNTLSTELYCIVVELSGNGYITYHIFVSLFTQMGHLKIPEVKLLIILTPWGDFDPHFRKNCPYFSKMLMGNRVWSMGKVFSAFFHHPFSCKTPKK